jgi:predicted transcriptional regulator
MPDVIVINGRLIAAARALADFTILELADKAGVAEKTIRNIESNSAVRVSTSQRHGCVSQEIWGRIVDALKRNNVELLPARHVSGAGVRWIRSPA